MIFMMFVVAYLLCCLVYFTCHGVLLAGKWLLTKRSAPTAPAADHRSAAAAQATTPGAQQDHPSPTPQQAKDVMEWTSLDDRQLQRLLDRKEP